MKKRGTSPGGQFENNSNRRSVIKNSATHNKRKAARSKSIINTMADDDDLFIPKYSNSSVSKMKPKKKHKFSIEDQIDIHKMPSNQNSSNDFNTMINSDGSIDNSIQLTTDTGNSNDIYIEGTITKPISKRMPSNFVVSNVQKDDDSFDDENDVLKISPWSIFVSIYKPIFLKMFPNESKMEIYHRLQKKWDEFDENDKKAYIDKANYRNRAITRQNRKEIRIRNKDKKDRKTVSPYSLYVAERHQTLKTQQPELSLSERALMIATEWNSMSSIEKRPYSNLAKRRTRQMNKQSSDDSDFDEE